MNSARMDTTSAHLINACSGTLIPHNRDTGGTESGMTKKRSDCGQTTSKGSRKCTGCNHRTPIQFGWRCRIQWCRTSHDGGAIVTMTTYNNPHGHCADHIARKRFRNPGIFSSPGRITYFPLRSPQGE
ncbi:hypothetical protein BDZ89DRAFT_650320 [Hymenopellis radicata]|nr:hypothetical protein BDZ89DRAFT_650320 [Hymenopellis radicata]